MKTINSGLMAILALLIIGPNSKSFAEKPSESSVVASRIKAMNLIKGADAKATSDCIGFTKGPVLLRGVAASGKTITAKLTIVVAKPDDLYFGLPRWGNSSFGPNTMSRASEGKKAWHLPDYFPPETVIKNIEIENDGQPVLIPMAAFSDICNLLSVALYPTKKGFEMKLVGGDAAASYVAVLKFDGRFYKDRKMSLGEDPNGDGFE